MEHTFNPFENVYELHIEVSDSCNLNCSYCYYVAKKKRRTTFTHNKLDKILSEFFAKTSCDVTMVFHGGEPLMASPEWIDQACQIAYKHAQLNGHKVCFHLQTNGTLLTDRHINVLKLHHFSVNVSLDGPESIHNSARGGYQKTLSSIEKLQESDIFTGVITVIGKHNYNHVSEIVDLFVINGIKRYHFNVGSILNGNAGLILSKDEILTYLKESYYEFVTSYRKSCNWVLLGKLRRFVSEEIPPLACDSPVCGAAIHKIHVMRNGDFYPCGSCVSTNDGANNFVLGNINGEFSESEYEKFMLNFHSIFFDHRDYCANCDAHTICDFFCPAFDRYDSITKKNKCEAYKCFFKFLQDRNIKEITDIIDFYETNR